MKVRELKEMLCDVSDDSAEVVVKDNKGVEMCASRILAARHEREFKNLVQEECAINDGEPFTYTKAEYNERVVLVI